MITQITNVSSQHLETLSQMLIQSPSSQRKDLRGDIRSEILKHIHLDKIQSQKGGGLRSSNTSNFSFGLHSYKVVGIAGENSFNRIIITYQGIEYEIHSALKGNFPDGVVEVFPIQTIDINKQILQFKYYFYKDFDVNHNCSRWNFNVIQNQDDSTTQKWFDFTVLEINKNQGKVIMMNKNNHSLEFGKKGIPEKMILEAKIKLNKQVISSSNNGNEFRTANATKVWDRLVNVGKATLNEINDVYQTN